MQEPYRRLALAILCLTIISWGGRANAGPMLGFPKFADPADNPTTPEKVALGKKIFFDKSLSRDRSISCASCHDPKLAFSDGRPQSIGVTTARGTRNTPSLLTAAANATQFWDGRRGSLEDQALDPFLNEKEHGLRNEAELLSTLQRDGSYPPLFSAAFGKGAAEIRSRDVRRALASFQRSIAGGNSAFDQYFLLGRKEAISVSAQRGLALFQGRAQCASCHTIGKDSASFSDGEFHSLGIGLPHIAERLDEVVTAFLLSSRSSGSMDQSVIGNPSIAELGRFVVTLNPADIGKFRTPSLRNVALTQPYMHDGSVRSLPEAIDRELYFRGNNGRPLILTPGEKLDLLEFLKSLDSSLSP